nr:hypothetical protein [Tanacetum cinerariifolium]
TYHNEKVLLCKHAEKGVLLQADQVDWLADTDKEIYKQELEAHYIYMPKIQEQVNLGFEGKKIAKPITPTSESASEEDSDPEQAQRDKDMQKNLALIVKYLKKIYKPTNNNLITSLNFRNKNVDTSSRYNNDDQTGQFGNQRTVTIAGARGTVGSQGVQHTGIQCFNYKEFSHFAKECRKPKKEKDYTYHNEKVLLCKHAEKESLNIQDVKTNLFWEFRKFTSHDGESMESYYSRFYKMMNEMIRNNLTVATMQEFLKKIKKIFFTDPEDGVRINPDAVFRRFVLTLLEHQDILSKFSCSSWWEKLCDKTSGEIIPSRDGSRGRRSSQLIAWSRREKQNRRKRVVFLVAPLRGTPWLLREAQWHFDSPRG